MSGRLRHIALTVEQPGTKSYVWVLIESAGGRLFVLKKGLRAHGTYLAALSEGYEELALLSACGLHEQGVVDDTLHSDQAPVFAANEPEMLHAP